MNRPAVNIHDENQVREAAVSGVNKLANLVKATLGAKGRNILLARRHITKDGVSVAREVYLPDPLENHFAQLVKDVAQKTNFDAGDGTTTATVIAQAIIQLGMKYVTAGHNPMEIKSGIDKAVLEIVKYLDTIKVQVTNDSPKIQQIATISANGDTEIGGLIAKAFAKIGAEGAIDVEESKTSKTELDIVDGMEVEEGFISPFFITNFQKGTVEFENPLIFICDKKIQKIEHIAPILEANMQISADSNRPPRPIVFMAADVEGEALATLIANARPDRQQGKPRVPFAAMKAPRFGKDRSDFLEDIAIMTGGQVISDTKGTGFQAATMEMMGSADKIIIKRDRTTIIKGHGDPQMIKNRSEDLRRHIKEEREDSRKRLLESRLSKVNGAVAILRVGAYSQAEVKEKKDRIEDAINATKAAAAEGIVAGGGVALYFGKYSLDEIQDLTPDEKIGVKIVAKALESPIKQILTNAGYAYKPKTITDKIAHFFHRKTKMDAILKEVDETGFGYDVRQEKLVDMIIEGIIDPKKVTRVALENAAGVSGLILTTQGAMTEIQ